MLWSSSVLSSVVSAAKMSPRLFLAKYPRDTRFSTSPSSIRCSAARSVPMLS